MPPAPRDVRRSLVTLLWLMLIIVTWPAHAARPNIVLIVADDLGYGELGCQGNPQIPTPWIDSIAAGGVRFTNGYVTASYCAPSRAGLLTGRYQSRFGFNTNPVGALNEDPAIGLPTTETTIADMLQRAGYATALIGKWHLGGTAQYHPQRRGFDEFFGFSHEGHFYAPLSDDGTVTWLRRRALPDGGTGRWTSHDGRLILSTHLGTHEPDYDANNPLVRGSQPVSETRYLTRVFSEEACQFIDRHAERPFFLSLAYNAVHSPMQAPVESMKPFADLPDVQRRIFAGMLAELDAGVGRVLNTLKSNDLDRQTLVVFLSDNGGPTAELTSSNAPLRGGKGTYYEGGVRIPFLLKWPEQISAGQVINDPVISLDLVPTLLEATGASLSLAPRKLDGVSLLPLLSSSKSLPERTLYWSFGPRAGLRQGRFKLVRPSRRANWELYDLQRDLSESHDLAADDPERLKTLRQHWENWSAGQDSSAP